MKCFRVRAHLIETSNIFETSENYCFCGKGSKKMMRTKENAANDTPRNSRENFRVLMKINMSLIVIRPLNDRYVHCRLATRGRLCTPKTRVRRFSCN